MNDWFGVTQASLRSYFDDHLVVPVAKVVDVEVRHVRCLEREAVSVPLRPARLVENVDEKVVRVPLERGPRAHVHRQEQLPRRLKPDRFFRSSRGSGVWGWARLSSAGLGWGSRYET